MGSEKPLMSQKEYLKKYLSKDKVKKKKKKSKISSSSHLKRSVIIDDDDDLGLKDVATVDDEEFNLDYLGDEAPQIVGIVDERPAELKAKEKYQNNLWRPIAEENVDDNFENLTKTDNVSHTVKKHDSEDSDLSLGRPQKNFKDENVKSRKRISDKHHSLKKNDSDDDSDPSLERPRKNFTNENMKNRGRKRSSDKSNNDSDLSPERTFRRKRSDSDSDMSPPRISKNKTKYSNKKEISSSNRSSDRSKRDKNYFKDDNFNRHNSKQKQRLTEYSDSEYSSKDHRYRKNDENRRNEDREKIKMREEGKRYNKDRHYEKRTSYDKNEHSDLSPERKKSKNRRNSDSDMSPPRSSRSKYKHSNENRGLVETRDRVNRDKDYYKDDKFSNKKNDGKSESSLRKSQFKDGSPGHYKKAKNEDTDSDLSPERNRHSSKKKNMNEITSKDNIKEKMLDGKKSGLQDAKHLKEELKRLKETEDQQFKKMDPKLLGANVAPIKRDRKTGLVRNIEKEVKQDKAKAEKKAKTEEKYYKWGKGLKQIQEQEDRVADAIHEMSKPLARYRDDKDLDAFLKAQEREGDPMLEYIRSKQAESHNVIDLTVGSSKPKYNGSFMPNRFGIPPGYRWDGVDRSNGYEKKWFEQRNARKAVEEEAYKWSTSDM